MHRGSQFLPDFRLITNHYFRITGIYCLLVLAPMPTWQVVLGAQNDQDNKADKSERVSDLTLETLYHPLNQIDFDGKTTSTHWVDDVDSQLLVLRDETWKQLDLKTGTESDWKVAQSLIEKLMQLEDVSESQAKSAVNTAVAQLKSEEETFLAKINQSLAIVSQSKGARWLSRNVTEWQEIAMDPTGKIVAYVEKNNLYLMDTERNRRFQLSQDGSDVLLNGRLDWTYQEEIYGRGNFRGFWFSHDGNWLASLKIDIEEVPSYSLGSSSGQRGIGVVSRYPKAGDPIPHATLQLWDLRRIESGRIPKPKELVTSTAARERLITGVWWHPYQGGLIYSLSDRQQSWREIHVIDPRMKQRFGSNDTLVLQEESNSWIEPPAEPGYFRNGDFLWRSELPSGYGQLYHIQQQTDSKKPVAKHQQKTRSVTPSKIDVRDFWISPDEQTLYYTADALTRTVEQHLYRTDLPNAMLDNPSATAQALIEGNPLVESKSTSQCITSDAGWHQPSLSPDGNWMVDVHSSASHPAKISAHSLQTDRSWLITDAQLNLHQPLHQPELFSIPLSDELSVPGMLIRPTKNDDSPVPVVVEVYGGPGSPIAKNRWAGTRSLYRELLARQGIATFLIDNRSSAGRGLSDAWKIRGRVGEIELEDLKTAMAWLKQQSWVDADRLAIRGWSFGGFMTLYAMTHMKDFRAGIAGGSVTDWSEYDAFYTERYMGLPKDNPKGYQITSPLHFAKDLHGAIMLIHGESDDNVHPSGTLRMANALQKAGNLFDLMIYPDEAHAIRQRDNVWHLSKMTHEFLKEHLTK